MQFVARFRNGVTDQLNRSFRIHFVKRHDPLRLCGIDFIDPVNGGLFVAKE
jgi:hypothetical protein